MGFLFSLATIFHSTAFFMIFLAFSGLKKINYKFFISIFLIITLSIFSYFLFKNSFDHLIYFYLGEGMHFSSSGALPRYLINFIAALICFIFWKKLSTNPIERRLYLLMSSFVFICLPFTIYFSSASDRILLYFIPLQLFIFSKLHILFNLTRYRIMINYTVIGFYSLILLLVLNLAKHRGSWINYSFKFYDEVTFMEAKLPTNKPIQNDL